MSWADSSVVEFVGQILEFLVSTDGFVLLMANSTPQTQPELEVLFVSDVTCPLFGGDW